MFDSLRTLFSLKDLSEFDKLISPYLQIKEELSPLHNAKNALLQYDFDQQFRSLIYYHLYNLESGRELLDKIETNPLCREMIGLPKTLKKSTFFEALNTRGLDQLIEVFEKLYHQVFPDLKSKYDSLGKLISIDGSLIQATLAMCWAHYRREDRKAKNHLGFNVNLGIPKKWVLTDGKQDEKKYVDELLSVGETGILDRYYHSHEHFDHWHQQKKFFVCRIRNSHRKTVLQKFENPKKSAIHFDGIVKLGTPEINETQNTFRLVGFYVDKKIFWVVTNRFELSALEIAQIYQLRWTIESFFKWWKKNAAVYHILARSEYGLNVQIVAGLITFLLIQLYCQKDTKEMINIHYVRKIQSQIDQDLFPNHLRNKKGFIGKIAYFLIKKLIATT